MAEKQIWDDALFKRVVRQKAKERGMPLRAVFEAAGLSKFYLKPPPGGGESVGRSTNAILNIAEALRISPIEFFGAPDLTPQLEKAMCRWREIESGIPSGVSHDEGSAMEDDLRLERVRVAERIIATQLATLICIASNRADTDPAVLLRLIMQEINHSKKLMRTPAQPEGGDPSSTKRRGTKRSSPSRANQTPSSL